MQFKPSGSEDLGFDIVAEAKSYVPTSVSNYVYQTAAAYLPTMAAQAVGISAGPEVYATVPEVMKHTPSSLTDAYAQAMYWLNLAMQRAVYANNSTARGQLSGPYSALAAEAAQAEVPWTSGSGLLCHLTGYGCPKKGRSEVLDYAASALKVSSLAQVDKDKITPVLEGAARNVRLQQALPFVFFVGVGAAAGTWWMKRPR